MYLIETPLHKTQKLNARRFLKVYQVCFAGGFPFREIEILPDQTKIELDLPFRRQCCDSGYTFELRYSNQSGTRTDKICVKGNYEG